MSNVFERLRAYNDLLEEELEGRPGAVKFLAEARAVTAKAVHLLERLREHVSLAPDVESFDIRPLLEGVVRRCRNVLPQGRALHLDVPDDEIVVAGSLLQLQDLFMKLVLGMAERTAADAAGMAVRTSPQTFDERACRLLRASCVPGRYVCVSCGVGAPLFSVDKLTLFWDGLLSASGSGEARDLVQLQAYGMLVAHRGELFYEMDANGQAICQHLLLPLQPGRKDMQAPHNLEDDSLRGSETILLVDDEDMIWDVIIDMLQQLGYSVILAGNGLEAVEIYQANPGQIDLVILDMVMPKLDGHKAFFQLKAIDSKVRVLLSSGYVSEEDAADVLAAGALGFLQKPYRMADLARKVRSIFDVPRA
jgi:CheY-like chemotaxis protein